MRTLPPKTPMPDLTKYRWEWNARYFDVGDKIEWVELFGGAKRVAEVGAVKVNKFGRVTYYTTSGEMVLTEEVQRAAQLISKETK